MVVSYLNATPDKHGCQVVSDSIAYIKARLYSKQYHNLLKSVCLSLYRKNTGKK